MISLLWALATSVAQADDPTCPADGGWLDGHAHLRAIFLDLRGEVPEPEDYDALLSDGEVTRTAVDQLLDSPRFAARAIRFHQTLFWNDISDRRLMPADTLLDQRNGIFFLPTRAQTYRGAPGRHCGTGEARFDENGQPIPVTGPDGTISEGWVTVRPYWDPDAELQVCAYDAQEVAVSNTGTACDTTRAWREAGCGCGPNLQWCAVAAEEATLVDSFAREIDKRVERMVERDRSWLTLLSGTRGFVNGPIVDFYRHRANFPEGLRFREAAVDVATLPELRWDEASTWVEVELGDEHAGILTSPVFLLRFQTARARANQYHESFLCEPFQPPDGGLPELDDPDPTLDLTAREGCQYCHALLEPAAAHWGRWTQFGAGYLDPERFPVFDATCAACVADPDVDCSDACEDYYLVRPISTEQDPFVGQLTAYEFLEERHFDNVEQGPKRLVNQHDLDGRLPACAARKTSEWLLGRALTPSDDAWLAGLANDFATGGYSWRQLVQDIVLSDAYRSVE